MDRPAPGSPPACGGSDDRRATDRPRRGRSIATDDPHPADSTRSLHDFVVRVRQDARLDTDSEAEALSRATFRQLGEQVSRGQAEKLASGLPRELSAELLTPTAAQARSFDRRTFVDAVSGSTGATDLDEADGQVRAVLATLGSWAPDSELSDTVGQLPDDLAAMLQPR
ncbi:DUF2267 domain-containing protein [Pseudonocardia nantongensis]|uniref:DUF2267 domain-containing protein n=1 Tax=Pseudonocardia nantongensis TaxID=1181885 RepID=UPI003978BA5A